MGSRLGFVDDVLMSPGSRSLDSFESADNENVDRASSEDKMESIQTRVRFPETWLWIDAVSG